jgi:hypothetical protein
MPSKSLAAGFVGVLLRKGATFLTDATFCDTWGLQIDPFAQRVIPHVTTKDLPAFQALITAAASADDPSTLLDGETTKRTSRTNTHDAGRTAFRRWFAALKTGPKIYQIVEKVLQEQDAHPRALLADLEVEDDAIPPYIIVKSTVETDLAKELFGEHAFTVSGFPRPEIVTAIDTIMHHAWERFRKARLRALKRLDEHRKAYVDAEEGKLHLILTRRFSY